MRIRSIVVSGECLDKLVRETRHWNWTDRLFFLQR